MSSDTTTFATHVAGGDITETWGNYVQNRMSPSYVVTSESGTYYAYPGVSGGTIYSGTTSTTVINNAIDALTSGRTWYEKVVLKGSFTIPAAASIELHDYTILDLYQAYLLKAADGSTPVITNEDQTSGNTKMAIFGGHINGNRTGNSPTTDCRGVFIENNNQVMSPYDCVLLRDMKLYNFYGDAYKIQLNASNSMVINNCKIVTEGGNDCTRVGFYLKAGDSRLHKLTVNSYYENLILEGGTFVVSDSYFGGGCSAAPSESAIYLYGNNRCQFTNCLVDGNYKHAFLLSGTDYNHFVNCRVRGKDQLTATNTWTGFRLTNADYNLIASCYVGKYNAAVTDEYKYGIEETGTSNYNYFHGNIIGDYGTDDVIVLGAQTSEADTKSWT